MVGQSVFAVIMWHLLLLTPLIGHVWSERLPPPSHVHVGSLLRWSAPPAHSNLSYTVQYLSFDTKGWNNFSSCSQSQNTSCDVTANRKEAELGCVRLRVLAHGHNLTSDPEEACSQQGNRCSPEVQLSSQPGTLIVNLHGNHTLSYEHGSQVKHLVYFGREGEPLKKYRYSPSSVVIKELEEGRRYCVSVVFVFYEILVGPPSCVKCQDIPQSVWAKQITVTLVTVFSVIGVLVLFLVYVLFFERKRIAQWMRPPFEKGNCIKDPFPMQRQQTLLYSPSEERCDRISLIVPVGHQQPST
ncbi:unnamed protein product [Lota lota]